MKTSSTLLALLAFTSSSVSSPVSTHSRNEIREAERNSESAWTEPLLFAERSNVASDFDSDVRSLEKRRGGGGGGGGAGRGGGSSGGSSGGGRTGGTSSGGSSGSGRSGGSSGGTSSGGSSGSGRSGTSSGGGTSSRGGTTSSSSSTRPAYGGGTYYGGGSTRPYSAGTASPLGLTPFLLAGAGLGILAASWPLGAYQYQWHNPYRFHNTTDNQNETLPVDCLCQPYSACGCDEPNNSTYLDSLILPNGTSANTSVATIQKINGTEMIVLNGTLPNGTDDSTGNGARSSFSSQKALVDALLASAVVAGTMLL